MKSLLLCLVLLFGYTLAVEEQPMRFDNYRLYRLTPKTADAFRQLKDLENLYTEVDFWSTPAGVHVPVDLVVPPKYINAIENFVNTSLVESVLLNNNIQNLIDAENVKSRSLRFDWEEYKSLDEINAWLETLATDYPNNVELINAGTSYEGRTLVGIKISFSPENANRAIFLESNIHAREWITSAVSTYIINELLTSTDADVRNLAESYDWYIVPVFNPDGFVYTKTTNRLWRKTRVPYGILCYGADPNRNWGYHWNEGGASDNSCSDTYAGPRAFSEPSTKSASEFIETVGDKLVGYISFHSYSQLLLLSYGYTYDHLDNYDELMEISEKAITTLAARYGTRYVAGNIPEAIYVASGGSMDWVKGTFGTPVTYTYELRDTGAYGFLLPPEQIIPTGEETLDSLVTIFKEYEAKHPNTKN